MASTRPKTVPIDQLGQAVRPYPGSTREETLQLGLIPLKAGGLDLIAGTTWPTGLTDQEAAQQRARGGGGQTADRGSVSLRRILRRNVFTILNRVLFGVSLVLLAFGLYLDAAFTAVPVATNIAVAVLLEVDAKRKLDRLTLITRPDVTVRRSGHDRRTTPDDLVTGDVLIVERGDQAVVDGRLTAGAIEVDESALTGESEPVSKRPRSSSRSAS
jgi:cation-transporting ATPase E